MALNMLKYTSMMLLYCLAVYGLAHYLPLPKLAEVLPIESHPKPENPQNVSKPKIPEPTMSIYDELYELFSGRIQVPTSFPLSQLYNSETTKPDYENDLYFVTKRNDYCKEHFDYYAKASSNEFKTKLMFIDYPPNNALRQELSKKFSLVSTNIYTAAISKKIVQKRKNLKLDHKSRVLFTNSSLYYTMKIGTHYRCMFQTANHAPGAGYITRPDLLAGLVKKHIASHITSRLDLTFVPQTYRLFKKQECQAFFSIMRASESAHGSSSASPGESDHNNVMFVKKYVNTKRSLKLTNLERLGLDKLYKGGALCGHKVRARRVVVQEFVRNQMLFEDKFHFTIRAFMFVASYDPLTVYYHEDGLELKQPDEMSTTRVKEFKDLEVFLLSKGLIKSAAEFEKRIKQQIKQIMRTVIELSVDKLYKDPQFFDIYSFQMILDPNLKLRLLSVTQKPDLKLRNKDTVEKMLTFLFDLNHYRNTAVRSLLVSVAERVSRMRKLTALNPLGEQTLRQLLERLQNTDGLKEEFEKRRRSWDETLRLPASFEVVWDSRNLSVLA